MKKVLALILCVMMVLAVAAPVAATENTALPSPGAEEADLAPILTEKSALIVKLHTTEDVLEQPDAIQKLMAEAKLALAGALEKVNEALQKKFAIRYFFYVEIVGDEEKVSVDFEPIDHNDIRFMQYIDAEWMELEHLLNADETITVKDVVEGPLAVFVN